MSESQSAASGVSGAGQGVSSVGQGAAGGVGSYGSMTSGVMGSGAGPVSNGVGAGTQGFSFGGADNVAAASNMGPTAAAGQNIDTYGTATPGFMDKAVNMYDRLNKGGEQNIVQAYKNRGNNPETYGYALAKLNSLTNGAAAPEAPPMVTNISYQQPENSYLRRFRRY